MLHEKNCRKEQNLLGNSWEEESKNEGMLGLIQQEILQYVAQLVYDEIISQEDERGISPQIYKSYNVQ